MKRKAIDLGWLEQLFYESFYPQKEIDKKALTKWATDNVDDSTNFNKIYAMKRAIKRFFNAKGNKNAFSIDWVELINSDLELKQNWKKEMEKEKQKIIEEKKDVEK